MSEYKYDVFLSYSRKGNPPQWVHNHFLPQLRNYLSDETGDEPRIFVDQNMPIGVVWPDELEQALAHAKILVPIYSPQYFRSEWCVAEWKSMAAREEKLGLASRELTRGLIFPVRYSDSDYFPDYGKDRMWHDMKGLDRPDPMFQETPDWHLFHRKMREIAGDLAKLLNDAPPWQPGWPTVRPDVPIPPTTSFPRW